MGEHSYLREKSKAAKATLHTIVNPYHQGGHYERICLKMRQYQHRSDRRLMRGLLMDIRESGAQLREGSLVDMVRLCFDLSGKGVRDAGVCFVGSCEQDIIQGYAQISEEFKTPCSKMSDLAALLTRTKVQWGVTWIDRHSKSQVMDTMVSIAEKVYNTKQFSSATIIRGVPSCKLELAATPT